MTTAMGRERRSLRLSTLRARPFWVGSAAWLVFFLYPLVPGSIIRAAYGELEHHGATGRFFVFTFGLVIAELGMATIIGFGHAVYAAAFEAIESLVRGNVLNSILASGGPDGVSRSVSSGDVVTRLRDDPKDMVMLLDNWVDVLGSVMFGSVAFFLLARIDVLATLAMIVPLVLFGAANRLAGHRLRRMRSAAREATSDATDFLNAAFGAALTVKVSGAYPGVLARVDRLNRRRSRTMVSDQTWTEAMWSINSSVGDICLGAALLVAVRRFGDIGDVALFAAYAMNLIWLPQNKELNCP